MKPHKCRVCDRHGAISKRDRREYLRAVRAERRWRVNQSGAHDAAMRAARKSDFWPPSLGYRYKPGVAMRRAERAYDRFVAVRDIDALRVSREARREVVLCVTDEGTDVRAEACATSPAVRVVAIEGKISPTRTPALRAPVFADAKGRRIVDHGDRFEVVGDAPFDAPGQTTRLAAPIVGRHGFTCLVLGDAELDVFRRSKRPTNAVIASLIESVGADRSTRTDTSASRTETGPYAVLHCSLHDAHEVMGIVRAQVEIELAHALRASDVARAYRHAFWLQRASTTSEGWLIAVAALDRVKYEDAARAVRTAALDHVDEPHEPMLRAADAAIEDMVMGSLDDRLVAG